MSDGEDKNLANDEIPPCMIHVDREGKWFHNDVPIVHPELLALFFKSLDVDVKGRYIVTLKDQICRLSVEDTPFVIVRTDFVSDSSQREEGSFVLRLIDHSEESLDPETLWIGPGDVLYCKIRKGRFKARFSRPAYYQLAEYLQEEPETGRHFLLLNNKKYHLEKTH